MKRNKNKRFVPVCTCTTCHDHSQSTVAKQHRAINRMLVALDEKNRRRFVGLLALQWGHGGIEQLREITGLSRMTIRRGRDEIQRREQVPAGRIRQVGGGRQPVEKKRPVSGRRSTSCSRRPRPEIPLRGPNGFVKPCVRSKRN